MDEAELNTASSDRLIVKARSLLTLLCLLLLVGGGCGDLDGFATGEQPGEPSCPDESDCSAQECGPDPVCGLSCGTCSDGDSCTEAGVCCQPKTCAELGSDCGTTDDGCGGLLECGVCTLGTECAPQEDGAQSCTCPTANDGASVWLNIPTVGLTLRPLIDGEVPDGDNTSQDNHPNFLMKPLDQPSGVGWANVKLGLFDSASGDVRSDLEFRLLPGQYALYYERGGEQRDGPWPLNSRYRLLNQLSAQTDQDVSVEVDTVEVDLDLRVDGLPLGELPLVDGQVIEVQLQAGGGSATVAHLEGGNPEGSWLLTSARLIPSGYVVSWSNNLGQKDHPMEFAQSSDLPLGEGLVGSAVSVDAETETLQISIETAQVEVTLRQDGALPSELGFGAGDDPRVLLIPRREGPGPETGPGAERRDLDITLPPFWKPGSSASSDSLVVKVLPGNYDVLYVHTPPQLDPLDGVERRWALNHAKLQDNQTFYDSAEFEWDLATSELSVDVELDGAPLSSESCEGRSGEISLFSSEPFPSRMRTQWRLPDFCSGATNAVRTPYTLRLVDGIYDINYMTPFDDVGPDWPEHQAAVTLAVSQAVGGGKPLTLNVPVIELDLQVTIEGQVPQVFEPGEELDQWPRIEFAELGMDSQRELGWNPRPSVVLALEPSLPTVRIIPSNYTFSYLAKEVGLEEEWPNASYRLESSVSLDEDLSLSRDLNYSRVGIQIALDELPATSENTSETDHGKVTLVRKGLRGTFDWVSSWHTPGKPGAVQWVNLPAGEYHAMYYPAGYEYSSTISFETVDKNRRWPVTAGLYSGCIVVE